MLHATSLSGITGKSNADMLSNDIHAVGSDNSEKVWALVPGYYPQLKVEMTLPEGALSEGTAVQDLPSLHVTLCGLSNLSLDLTGYDEGSNAPDGSKKDRRLRIYGTAKNLATPESLLVEEIDFTYAREPGVTYRQTFIPPVAYEAIGEKRLVGYVPESKPDPVPSEDEDDTTAQEGGCNAGLNAAMFLFALLTLLALLVGGWLSLRSSRRL